MTDWPQNSATFTSADIASLLDATLSVQQPDQVQFVMSQRAFDMLRFVAAKNQWREWYRAARVLGNRQLAIERVGSQREGFYEEYRR